MPALYHYTCSHWAAAIARSHTLDPAVSVWNLVWLTDLDHPDRDGLGLTSRTLTCDRTRYRFIVDHPVDVQRWVDVRRTFPLSVRQGLETAPRAMPMHWYLTATEQRARLG